MKDMDEPRYTEREFHQVFVISLLLQLVSIGLGFSASAWLLPWLKGN